MEGQEAIEIEHRVDGDKGAFEVHRDGELLAEMTYSRVNANKVIIDHTLVDDRLRGQGVATKLLRRAVDWARAEEQTILPLCPFAKAGFERHPELRDVLA